MAAKKAFGLVEIDDATIDQILEAINDIELNNLEGILSNDVIQLKKSAAKFLQIVSETQEKIRNIENMMMTQKKLRNKIRKELGVTGRFLPQYETDEYIKNREELNNDLRSQEVEKIYDAAFTFHEEINAVLGQEVKTIILLQNKEGEPFLFEVSKEELLNNNILSFEETSKTARLNARFKVTIDQMRQAGIKAIERDDLEINDKLNINKLNETYKTVLYRYDTYKRLVLWLFPKGVWNWSKISARGDIAEAYSMFFLKKAEYNFQKDLETNINYFMVLGVQEVDNVSGLLQGDISSGQYEYAIKSADASYMSVQQMIPLATEIVINNNYSLTNLKNYKDKLAKKKAKIRNPIYNSLDNTISKDIQNVIKDFS